MTPDTPQSTSERKNWPHAPVHWLFEPGIYMITSGTYQKHHHFKEPRRKDYLMSMLFDLSEAFQWRLEAWSILDNHYHMIARSPEDPESLRAFLGKLHMKTAQFVNTLDGTPGRRVWYQYWDSRITYPASYLARLAYVHLNAVHHQVVSRAEEYPWCSASWFVEHAPPAFVETLRRFRTDRVSVKDWW